MRTLWVVLAGIMLVALSLTGVVRYAKSTRCENPKAWYLSYNERYFDGQLPLDTIVDYSETDPDVLASTTQANGRFHIAFNPKLAGSAVVLHTFLFHESCHILSWNEPEKHGTKWKACMYHAVSKGAIVEQMIESYND